MSVLLLDKIEDCNNIVDCDEFSKSIVNNGI